MENKEAKQNSKKTNMPKKSVLFFKRIFDVVFSFLGLVILSPVILLCILLVGFSFSGSIFFRQERIGKNGRPFIIYKFRTMKDNQGPKITTSGDERITSIGKVLRKTKLDELPQLWNVFIGDMSIVGPRPEVAEYVKLYSEEQGNVLLVRPGITSLASIEYWNENELLSKSSDPNRTYIEEIMPKKLEMDLRYLSLASVSYDISLIFKTIARWFS